MNKHSFTAGLAAIALLATLQSAAPAIPSILDSAVNPANGHTYYLLDNSIWTDAESKAITLGGHLATINDSAENDWVWNRWGTDRSLWIGLNDAAVEGTFVWSSGELSSYRHFLPGEPNNANGNEDYVYIYAKGVVSNSGEWNDFSNSLHDPNQPPQYGVVEVVPEPSGGLLLLWCLFAGLGRKRN